MVRIECPVCHLGGLYYRGKVDEKWWHWWPNDPAYDPAWVEVMDGCTQCGFLPEEYSEVERQLEELAFEKMLDEDWS